MTRLTATDMANLNNWEKYDHCIHQALGVNLLALAAAAVDLPVGAVRLGLKGRKLAAVSISSGEGVVGGFAESLASIGEHLGLESRVMASPDDEGLAQAAAWGADIIMYADDVRFIAYDTQGRIADNNPATSRVFVAALGFLAGQPSLAGAEVVVLGLGIIGRGAAKRLIELGATPLMYDPDQNRRNQAWSEVGGGQLLSSKEELARALGQTNLIFEAAPMAQVLDQTLWPKHPVVAAPGVPLAWPQEWLQPGGRGRLWHDPLQSGTAAMLAALSL